MRSKFNLFLKSGFIILVFLSGMYGKRLFPWLKISTDVEIFKTLYTYSLWFFPSLICALILFSPRELFKNLGLNQGFLLGLFFSLICVSPMLVSSAVIGKISENINYTILLKNTFLAGFMEEYFFRGFLFGLLFKKLRWGFISAGVLGSVIFGMGHLYQGSNWVELIGVFSVTALGAMWFAWLYIEWDNLWVPIFMHSLMNLSWILFEVSQNAIGGIVTNVFRAVTIALSIFITIRVNKTLGLKITLKNLFIN